MSWRFLPQVDERAGATLAQLRAGQIEGAREGAGLWLRDVSDDEDARLRVLPGVREVRATDEGVVRFGESLPYRDVPTLAWRPLAELLPVEAPALEQAEAAVIEPVPWTLVRTGEVTPATALLVSRETLAAFAKTAAAVRLERLRFCWLGDRAFVLGTPLPPLPGAAYWGESDLLPVGYRFAHSKARGRLTAKLPARRERTCYLWDVRGRFTVIAPEAWATLGRDNVQTEAP